MDVEHLVKEEFVPFREKIIEALSAKHPQIFSVINAMMAGKQNRVGLQVTEDGEVAGEYTMLLDGVRITEVKDTLSSEFHHPFLGVVRPYVVVEAASLQEMIHDDAFSQDAVAAIPKYLPDIALRFLH